ncbi:MAG: lysine--tRNA ligase [Kiritimatiellae bacterium]|nr:lysine--tRNA ligase [Kiritimatiellia bacterium]
MSNEHDSDEYREQRYRNMLALAERGYSPFGEAFARTGRLAELREGFEEGREVRAAGRLLTIRAMGKSIFADLHDGSGRFQIYLSSKDLDAAAFESFGLLDMGDHIGVTGRLFVTRMGEKSIHVSQWTLLAKALRPLPEKWHGLKDTEQRYRQRYLDLVANREVRERFDQRIAIVRAVREFLQERGYQEVETPMLQSEAGGAAARPFVTHYQALGADMVLRIAPELYLKRLLVGGFDRVFELNRNFRNEGLDRTHNPEFTMLELYEAYGNLDTMRELIQSLIVHAAMKVRGGTVIGTGEEALDLTPPFREAAYRDLVKERMGADWFDLPLPAARERAAAAGLDLAPDWDHLLVTHEVYEKLIEKTLRQPTFVTRVPARLIPLARVCQDDPECADVFELVIAGQEIAPAYTELNDPVEQRRRLEAQAGGETGKLDEAFLEALEHGMPPAGGMGVGIDRLVMVLTGAEAIRDVILFPQLRQK